MALSDLFEAPTTILSRWKLDESGNNTDPNDIGTLNNDLNAIGGAWADPDNTVFPAYEDEAFAYARFVFNLNTSTNARFERLNTQDYSNRNNFSVFGWVYPSGAHVNFPNGKIAVVMRDNQTINNSMRWMVEVTFAAGNVPETRSAYGYRDGTAKFGNTPSSNPLTSGTWNHVALTVDVPGGFIILYQNGVATTSGTISNTTGTGGNDDFALGGAANDTLNDWCGGLQDWVFVDRTLSPTEVSGIAQLASVSPSTDRGLGEHAYSRHYSSIRSTRRGKTVQMF